MRRGNYKKARHCAESYWTAAASYLPATVAQIRAQGYQYIYNKENFKDYNKSPNLTPHILESHHEYFLELNLTGRSVKYHVGFHVSGQGTLLRQRFFWGVKAFFVAHLQIKWLFYRLKICGYRGSCKCRTSHIQLKYSRYIVTVS